MLAILFRLLALVILLTLPPVVYNLQNGMGPAESVHAIPSAYEEGFHWAVETVEEQVAGPAQSEDDDARPTPTGSIAGPTPDPADAEREITGLQDGRALTGAIEQVVLEETNRRREEAGVGMLSWDEELAEVARDHSDDMSEHDYFAHENLEGQSPADRAEEAGYRCRKLMGFVITGVGENLYQGWLFDSYTERGGTRTYDYLTPKELGTLAVDSLMDSPGHRENILRAHFDRLGVGVAVSDDQKVYVTQNFC